MCGRFTLYHSPEEVAARFDAEDALLDSLAARYNIAPTQPVAVVTQESPGLRLLQAYKWGLIPSWAKDPAIGGKMINARAETLTEKPSYRTALLRRRCLLPADGFYEWQAGPDVGKAGRIPFHFRLHGGGLFAFAGLWDEWIAPDGSALRSCTLITTSPNALVSQAHDRMPAILRPEDEALWLDPSLTAAPDLLSLLAPLPADLMEGFPVSRQVNSPAFDDPACIAPA